MHPHAWLTLLVVALSLWSMARAGVSPALALPGAVAVLLFAGVISPAEALSGLANPAPWTVAALFVVARGAHRSGAVEALVGLVLARNGSRRARSWRLLLSAAGASAFLNNTPVVAMLLPRVEAWAKAHGDTPRGYLLPLSFAAILGGMTTLVGTSTHLVVSGSMEAVGMRPLGLFEMSGVGVPACLAGLGVLAWSARRLHPAPETRGTPAGPGTTRGRQENGVGTAGGKRHFVFLLVVLMVGSSATGLLPISHAAGGVVLLLLVSGTLTPGEVLRAAETPVIVAIVGALGLARAVERSGLADTLALGIASAGGAMGPLVALAGVVFATMLLTEIVTNNAAAALMFPVAMGTAAAVGAEPRAFAWAVALAASAAFLSPVGYQTNLMVLGPGGYRFSDFARVGIPLTAVLLVVLVTLIALQWEIR